MNATNREIRMRRTEKSELLQLNEIQMRRTSTMEEAIMQDTEKLRMKVLVLKSECEGYGNRER
ncbi:hypothetical protein L195_g050889, partial [Trifolium pratense]